MSIITNVNSVSAGDDRPPTLRERLQNYSELCILFSLSIYHHVRILILTLLSNPAGVFQISALRDKAFGNFWEGTAGGDLTTSPQRNFIGLLESATGTILDIGPGDGRVIKYFTNPRAEAIYGTEPCIALHKPLRQAIEAAGLAGKYHPVACGGQRESLWPALKGLGLLKDDEGVFDVIVCSKVLCTIPNPKDAVDSLYTLLKPGGRLLFTEHVKNSWRTPKGSILSRLVQFLLELLGWSFFLSGCELSRDTMAELRNVAKKDGGWESEDIERIGQWSALPFVLGELTKRS